MQYKLASISLLLASMASATPSASVTPSASATPSSSPSPTFTPRASSSPTFTPRASSSVSEVIPYNTNGPVNLEHFQCGYRGWGCNWSKSMHSYGNNCGTSPFKPGQQLRHYRVVAVSSDGSGDCASQAGDMCCQVLAEYPCQSGEKFLECNKPEIGMCNVQRG
ncbi:hypothetical protein N7463_006673 [Penicillium fimorum]|uniref:Uncharacterized protein n=1 Tax=Penicillium fimorum TaxID=1882269 RepID=A0A9W9XUW7_9EURO|nr:hypothetical protein N7463_006673 [Penicillium fimorum]